MRYTIIFLGVVGFLSCNFISEKKVDIDDSGRNKVKSHICEENYDSLLVRYANEFSATTVDLNGSLSSDLKVFLNSVDTGCLKKQTEYRYFIALILAKLALHHLQCCNQHYDLYQMNEGPASIIINGFNGLAAYESNNLEMLNSGLIIDYIKSDSSLSVKPPVLCVLNAYEIKNKSIKKMGT